jgi:hypothetical protein
MEFLIGAVLALVAWLLWNGLRPPGATVKSSLERERRRRGRGPGGTASRHLLLILLPIVVALSDSPAIAC